MTENEKILAGLLQGVHSWTDLKPKLSERNTSATDTTAKTTRAGKLFEYFTKLCFLHDSEFAAEYDCKDVYLYEEIPTDLKQKLNLPTVEHGIDLLIVDRDEKVIAIQCKFKNDETVKLNWNADKLGNFFGFARNADLHCVFSNSSDITQVAQNLTDNFKFFSYSHLQNISAATFEKMRNALIGKPLIEIEKIKPRYYQKKAIVAVVSHFKNFENERGQLILPCGAGKTLVSLWIKERLQAKNTLVLVPSLALLRQIKASWNEAYNTKFIRLNVCSEKDIDADIDNDIAITHTYEIPGNVTSDKNLVASFLQRPENKVVFSTYQSLQVVVDALQVVPDFQFDLIIADEAHKTAGFEDLNKFTLVHNKEKVRGVKRLYMTATPRIASPELKAKHTGRITFLKDMSNPKVYGKEAYRMTFGTAIAKKILVNYKIIAVGVSDSDLKKYIEKNIQLTKSESITDYAHNYALNIVMEKYKAFHALTFHSRIKNAVAFAARHNRLVPNAISTSISGTQTTSEREIILKAFEQADKAVVSNAKCLTEGVDVPVIDVVYYSDPKNSKIDIVQSAGRALRKAKHRNKEMGFIVVPIFHKDRETVEDAIEKSDYKNLITVIRSLCDQDERLVTEINELAWEKENRKQKATIEFTFSDDQTDRVIQFEQIQEKLKNALFNQVIETLKDSWEIHYKEVEQYFKANGNSSIPARYKLKNGFGIGTWCVSQRVNFNKGLLSDSEIKKLEKLNFDFDPDKSLFESDFQKLIDYKTKNGHVNVPTMGTYLGRKVNKFRIYYRKGNLSPERIERLNSIGFQFTFDEVKTWDERFEELLSYYETYNTKQVNSGINPSLYSWERRQKETYAKGKLEQEQIQKLNEIDFNWTYKIVRETKDKWDIRFEKFETYWKTNPSLDIPEQHLDYETLKLFVKDLKYNFGRNRLNDTRLDQLKEIGFDFNLMPTSETKEKQWDEFYERLKILKSTRGELLIPKSDEYSDLPPWIKAQRRAKMFGSLSETKENLLDEINFPWTGKIQANKESEEDIISNEKRWNESYNELKSFFIEHKTCLVPFTQDFTALRLWIITQRRSHNKNKLTTERKQLLDDLNFPWEVTVGARRKNAVKNRSNQEDEWNETFQELLNFYSEFKTFEIQSGEKYQRLRRWCSTQRIFNNKGSIQKYRFDKLNDLGFPWILKKGRKRINEPVEKNSYNAQWETMFKELIEFYDEHKSFDIPLDKKRGTLRRWMQTQQTLKRKGTITPERLSKLNDVNFPWSIKSPPVPNRFGKDNEGYFLQMFDQLFSFVIKHNHAIIPRGDKTTKPLALWLVKQRKLFREGKFPQERIEKFKRINVDLAYDRSKEFENIWMNRYNELVAFKEVNGNCRPSARSGNSKTLGSWVLLQRMDRKKNVLDDYKIELLNKIGFNWSGELKGETFKPKEDVWLTKYQLLLDFKAQHNTTIVPQHNKEIGRWVNDQRVNFKRKKLSEFRINKLNEIDFVWNVKQSKN
jgi:superfamily II DNA or RNA helicase